MNKELNEIFVKKFIIKPRQERLLFELNSNKYYEISNKLYDALNKQYEVYGIEKPNDEFIKQVKNVITDFNKDCYIVNFGEIKPFKEAFDEFMEDWGPIIILYSNDILLAKAECLFSAPLKSIFIHK